MPKQNKDFIEQFIAETIEQAGFSKLPKKFVESYKERLGVALSKRIGVQATALLSDKSMTKFTGMLRKNPKTSPSKIFKFYNKNIENFEEKIAEILFQFQKEYVEMAEKIKGGK